MRFNTPILIFSLRGGKKLLYFCVQTESMKLMRFDWEYVKEAGTFQCFLKVLLISSKSKHIPQLDKILPLLANQKVLSDALPKQNSFLGPAVFFFWMFSLVKRKAVSRSLAQEVSFKTIFYSMIDFMLLQNKYLISINIFGSLRQGEKF